jgi:two-component system CheB/CheR fusion protein
VRFKVRVGKLDKMVLDVINNLTVSESKVEDEDGHCYLMRIKPYMTEEKKINGVVISFMDIGTVIPEREGKASK